MNVTRNANRNVTGNVTRVSYALESTLASVRKSEQAAFEVAARSGFDQNECEHIAMAVREATMNAVVHGNHYDSARRVTVSFENTPESVTIAVRDEGAGFDPETLADPLAPENLFKPSGRGIFLIRSFMDKVDFLDASPGTEIAMTRFLRGPGRKARTDRETSQ
jgi:serine/threonine-protein kinase RsbW